MRHLRKPLCKYGGIPNPSRFFKKKTKIWETLSNLITQGRPVKGIHHCCREGDEHGVHELEQSIHHDAPQRGPGAHCAVDPVVAFQRALRQGAVAVLQLLIRQQLLPLPHLIRSDEGPAFPIQKLHLPLNNESSDASADNSRHFREKTTKLKKQRCNPKTELLSSARATSQVETDAGPKTNYRCAIPRKLTSKLELGAPAR